MNHSKRELIGISAQQPTHNYVAIDDFLETVNLIQDRRWVNG